MVHLLFTRICWVSTLSPTLPSSPLDERVSTGAVITHRSLPQYHLSSTPMPEPIQIGRPDQQYRHTSTKSTAIYMGPRYLASTEEFIGDIKTAVDQALPTRGISAFRDIAVLGLTWDNDEMGCATAQRRLLDVFSDKYDANCKSAVIPSEGEDMENVAIKFLTETLIAFRTRWDRPDVLMILVYSGHAAISPKMQWSGRINGYWPMTLRRPVVDWDDIKCNANSINGGHFICLFDCPCATVTEFELDATSPEIFGAAHPRCQRVQYGPWNQLGVIFPIEGRLVTILARYLEQLGGKPRSISQIFGDLMRADFAVGRELVGTFVHFFAKKRVSESPRVDQESREVHKNQESVVLAPPGRSGLTAVDFERAIGRLRASEYRVVVAVRIAYKVKPADTDVPVLDTKVWQKWLISALPPHLRSIPIQIQHVMQTDVLLLVVSMPLEIWDGLPSRITGYSWVGFVKQRRERDQH